MQKTDLSMLKATLQGIVHYVVSLRTPGLVCVRLSICWLSADLAAATQINNHQCSEGKTNYAACGSFASTYLQRTSRSLYLLSSKDIFPRPVRFVPVIVIIINRI